MGAVSPIHFIDYSKISDIIMWLDNTHVLKFCVTLQKMDRYGNVTPFHKEYSFMNKNNNTEQISIIRNYSFYYVIEDVKNKGYGSNTTIILKGNEVELLSMLLVNNIYPWYVGSSKSKIFGHDNDNRLMVKGSPKIQFPIDNRSFIEFRPIVIEYENTNEQKEGMRLIINDIDNYIDLPIDKFLEFCRYITKTDMVNAAMNMLTYVKTKPYGENLSGIGNGGQRFNNNEKKGFF